jgi:hypothetical protein
MSHVAPVAAGKILVLPAIFTLLKSWPKIRIEVGAFVELDNVICADMQIGSMPPAISSNVFFI